MRIKIGMKMALSFGIIMVLIFIMAVTSFDALGDVTSDLLKIDAAQERMGLADDIVIQYQATVSGIRAYVAYGDETYLGQVETNFNQVIKLEKELLAIARVEKKAEVQALIAETEMYKQAIMAEYLPLAREYTRALAVGDTTKAQANKIKISEISKRIASQVAFIEGTVNALSTNNKEVAGKLVKESSASAKSVSNISSGISLFVILFGLGVAVMLTYKIRTPIVHLTKVANEYAIGDLRNSIEVQSGDEMGELTASMKTMQQQFITMIANIRNASDQLVEVSEEMAASTEEVTATSSEISRNMQTVSMEADEGNKWMLEASQSLVQLSSLIQIAKRKSESTIEDSKNTLKIAENGRCKVNESVWKMDHIRNQTENSRQIIGELSDYSQKISLISDTITAIAKQTNLLALNAAIEAARAGEHGRGFAVVAEEVRKLAEQSNHGAQEITSLVSLVSGKTSMAVRAMEQNVAEVEKGVDTVKEAGVALDQILQSVEHIVHETDEIGKVTSEEVANSKQIVTLIDHLATIIENVAAHGEEVASSAEEQAMAMQTVAASAEETSAMAYQLRESVAKFRV